MRPQINLAEKYANAIAAKSQTKTWSGQVVRSTAADGTCLVRVAGSVQTCRAPTGSDGKPVQVAVNSTVMAMRYPGSMMLTIMGGGGGTSTVASSAVIAQVSSEVTQHDIAGPMHTGILATTQAPWAARHATHTQGVADTTWTIVHGFGYKPNVNITDSAGNQVIGEVDYPDVNTAVITFSGAMSGTADLS